MSIVSTAGPGIIQRLWDSPTFTTWGSLASRLLSTLVVLPLILVKFSAAEVVVWQLFATLTTLLGNWGRGDVQISVEAASNTITA